MCNRQGSDALLMENNYFLTKAAHERMFARAADGKH
jgi:hypothetical protein